MSYLILFTRDGREIAYASRPTLFEASVLAEDLSRQGEAAVVREMGTGKVVERSSRPGRRRRRDGTDHRRD